MDEREILEKIKNRYGMRLDEQGCYIGFNRYKNIAVKTTFEAMYYTHYICFNGVFLSSNKQSQSCFMYGKSGRSNDKIVEFLSDDSKYLLYCSDRNNPNIDNAVTLTKGNPMDYKIAYVLTHGYNKQYLMEDGFSEVLEQGSSSGT